MEEELKQDKALLIAPDVHIDRNVRVIGASHHGKTSLASMKLLQQAEEMGVKVVHSPEMKLPGQFDECTEIPPAFIEIMHKVRDFDTHYDLIDGNTRNESKHRKTCLKNRAKRKKKHKKR